MSFMDRLSLLHGWVIGPVLVLAVAGIVVVALRPGRRWWSVTLPVVAAASGAAVAALAWLLGHTGTVKDHYPPSFGLWIGGFLLAVGMAIGGWRSAGGWRRPVSIATIPLTAASAFLLINVHYGYWPTLGDLLGRPVPHQISRQALRDVLATRDDPLGSRSANSGAHSGAGVAGPASGVGAGVGGTDRVRKFAGPTAPAAPTAVSAESHGVLAPLDIPPGTSGFVHRTGKLYLPPAFFATPRPPLPVIVMFGGTPGGPDDWAHGGSAPQTADAYAADHDGAAPILAFVDFNGSFLGDTECVDGPNGKAETFLATDVPRFLADLLRIPADPQRWAVGGFSEGGTCAFELAVRHPDVYGSFLDLAGDWAPNVGSAAETLHKLYGGNRAAMEAHDPDQLLRAHRFGDLAGWYVAGDSDSRHIAVSHRLRRAAETAGVTFSETLVPGAHNWQFAAAAFRAALSDAAPRLASQPAARAHQEPQAAPDG